MSNLVLCGGIESNGEFCKVMCNLLTGELTYKSDYENINYVIGEVTVDDPITLPAIQALENLVKNNNLAGIIYTKRGVLAILNEYVAEWRPVTAATLATGQTFAIDTLIEIE